MKYLLVVSKCLMKINLLEMASGYLNDTVINKLSSSVGIDKSTAESGIEKIFPALLGI